MRRSATDLVASAVLINSLDSRFERPRKTKGPKGMEISKNMTFLPFFYKKVVSLKDEPVSLDTFVNFDPNIRSTGGFYSITYIPKMDRRYRKGKPYLIWQDLIGAQLCFSGPRHFGAAGTRIPEIGWIDRNSTLTDALWAVAKKHPGIPFYFSIDWIKYGNMIEKKAEEQGVDIDHRPFVVYAASTQRTNEINETHKLAPRRIRADIEKELKEIDNEFQEEMRSNETTSDND